MNKAKYLPANDRAHIIYKVSLVDALTNLVLGITKVIIAFFSGSIAVASDSVLNFGDVVVGFITMIGMKCSERQPTKKHPFGFGRLEYLTTIVAAAIMMVVGFEFARISIEHIIHPVETHVTYFQYFILVLIVITKFCLYYYNKKEGDMTRSDSLIGIAHDSNIDAYGTLCTILLILVDKLVPANLDGWISLGVACFIMLSSLMDISTTISLMLGEEPDQHLIEAIKETALSVKPVEGVRNIIIHTYGYNVRYGQMDIELPDNMDIRQASAVLEELEERLLDKYNIHFTFGLWPENITYKNAIHEFRAVDKGISVHRSINLT